jgi:DNA-binding IclR family transcriptional regulator
MPPDTSLRFDGETYIHTRDSRRLTIQLVRVLNTISDNAWHTLHELSELTGAPPASVSARLRDLRKARFGGHTISRRYIGSGLYEYKLGAGN